MRIAVAGAGLVGKRHMAVIGLAGAELASVTDIDPGAAMLAGSLGVPFHATIADALADRPDGLVVATPNDAHEDVALAAIAAGIPVLVEKPLAADPAAARRIVEAGRLAGVPVLTGHHRRHMPVIAEARNLIANGALGRIVSVHVTFWIAKPDAYFETPWRRQKGAGPVLVNLIHEIDLLRHLVGEVASVAAVSASTVRANPVEDAFAAVLSFGNGALGTVQVSDAVVSPWSWELTAHDNPAYPPTGENALFIGGTEASLALPRGEIWSDNGARDWWSSISRTTFPRAAADPLVAQMRNFTDVIAGRAGPVCSGEDGLRSLETLFALVEAAESGAVVRLAA